MKNKIALVLVLFLIVLLGGSGLIIYKLKTELDGKDVSKDNKQPVVETSSMEVLSIVDPLVTEIGDVLLIPSFLNDNEINEVFFSSNNVSIKDFSNEQKLYMAVKTYLANKNDIEAPRIPNLCKVNKLIIVIAVASNCIGIFCFWFPLAVIYAP